MSFYKVESIDAHTWRITDALDVYMYLVEGDHFSVLIDTGSGFKGLDEIVNKLSNKPIRVICTHGHLDHTGSNHLFNNVAIAWEEKEAVKDHQNHDYRQLVIPALLASYTDIEIRSQIQNLIDLPVKTNYEYLVDGQIIDLGHRSLEVILTPGHTPGSICLLDRGNRMLFGGDMTCSMGVLLHLNHSASVEEFRDSMQKLLSFESAFDAIYPGHQEVPVRADLIRRFLKCSEEIIANEIQSIKLPADAVGDGFLAQSQGVSIIHKGSN